MNVHAQPRAVRQMISTLAKGPVAISLLLCAAMIPGSLGAIATAQPEHTSTNAHPGEQPADPPSADAVAADVDADFEQLLAENPEHQNDIAEIEAALAEDEEAEESFLAYQDSMEANPDLASHESAFYQAVEDDEELAARLSELEDAAAEDPEAAEQMAAFDSLLASDEELATLMQEVEREAAGNAELLDQYGEAIAEIEGDSELAAAIFATESGPTYTGAAPVVVVYVDYLRAHPRLHRAWWRFYHHLWARPSLDSAFKAHWRWWRPRPQLWKRWWRYRLCAARKPAVHRIVWQRRLWLGRRPRMHRDLWHHRLVIARRPVLRRHASFMRRHPSITERVVYHRRAVRHTPPHLRKPPKPAPKPAARTKPKPPRRRP